MFLNCEFMPVVYL